MSAARATRTLPGFRFETKAPPLAESLPRMDVAVFVGFAASGPLQTPVALESEAQFEALFGGDAPLAWDLERGEQVYAYLAPAVRAFFGNGGRRCWVIRVAKRAGEDAKDVNRARYNYFPVPGLARAEFKKDGTISRIVPGFARARSEGSWSDSLSVSSALLSRPEQALRELELHDNAYVVHLARPAREEFAAGDLLRLTFETDRKVVFLTIDDISEIDPTVGSPPSAGSLPGSVLRVKGSKALWFEIVSPPSPPDSNARVHTFTHQHSDSAGADEQADINSFETVYNATFAADEANEKIILDIQDCTSADAPPPGSVIRVDVGPEQLWLTVEGLEFKVSKATATVSGRAVRLIKQPSVLPSATPSCERLTFEIWVRKAEEYSVSLSDVGFESRHRRFCGSLPTDEALYQDWEDVGRDTTATVIWRQIGDLFRFPLAGVEGANEVYFPLAMAAVPELFLGAVRLPGSQLQRDGLAEFDARLFIDRDLFAVGTEALSSQAEFLRYLSARPRLLTGMHAAFGLEEATIIAIPDAVHRGWSAAQEKQSPPLPDSPPPLRPVWWHFADCRPQTAEQTLALSECSPPAKLEPVPVRDPPTGNFLNCSISKVPAPRLSPSVNISASPPEVSTSGTFTLSWDSSPPLEANYVLEEATLPDFNDAETIYSGKLNSFTIYGRKTGDYFYRVKAAVKENFSDWSNGVVVRVASQSRWALKQEKDYTPDTLLAVQRALLRMCAARGDLFGVLTLPADYREDKAIEYVSVLKSASGAGTENVAPLSFGEANDFSYGAVFHPWLIGEGKQTDSLRRIPPCGAVSGVFAARALTGGAWIAPANQPMRGIVALAPPISRERRLDLQDAKINLLRQEPRGFIVLDADTLSDDEDFRPINVRRLLILLRRQALKLGATYVFEPNSPAFRRLVERGFTGMLDEMFVRGAFAGAKPATAYQVVADDSLNTSESVEQGRFIVELRVAPSLPLTFLTIRFIQSGDRSFVTEVR
ncbi:MAG: hypothetical protein QOF62_2409 [Pyrinomonadaceae bacterium]|nr:hypothetical protein [Pyrinomonadaceae bacterium]